MRRRDLLLGSAAAIAGGMFAARAEPAPPLVGYLGIERTEGPHLALDAFLGGLRDLGYVEGRNIRIEFRMAGYAEERFAPLAQELVALDPAVIVAFQPMFSYVAKATAAIPVVARMTLDPVASGYARSLARPGGNLTGVSSYSDSLYGKRLEIARDLVPGLARVGVLQRAATESGNTYLARTESAAKTLGLEIVPLIVRGADDLPGAFTTASAAGVGAIMPLRDPLIVDGRREIALLAASNHLPAIYDDREFCDAGGLISYGANLATLHRRAAYYVDRILRGAKPADLPIEEPTVFELVINLAAAKALPLAVPPTLLARADKVIE